MTDTPSNQTLYAILQRIESKVDKTNGSVAHNKAVINQLVGGLIVLSVLVVPLVVYALEQMFIK